MNPRDREPLVLALLTTALLVASGIAPRDRLVWALEVLPLAVGLPLLAVTHRRLRLTDVTYRALFFLACVILLGAYYTYTRVPLGEWAAQAFGWHRNHYDRLGHFAQGFAAAMLAREFLVRRGPLEPGKLLFFLVTCVCLAAAAAYELVEWWIALASGTQEHFLAAQGDPWDVQWDLAWVLIGALAAQALLGRVHDRALARIGAVRAAARSDRAGALARR